MKKLVTLFLFTFLVSCTPEASSKTVGTDTIKVDTSKVVDSVKVVKDSLKK